MKAIVALGGLLLLLVSLIRTCAGQEPGTAQERSGDLLPLRLQPRKPYGTVLLHRPRSPRVGINSMARGHYVAHSHVLKVLVECSYFNFRAIAKRALFCKEEKVGPDELFLGTGCPATRVGEDELVFDYPTSLCGIVTRVFSDGTVIYSRLIYVPRNQATCAELILECTISRAYFSPREIPINISLSRRFPLLFPGQCWFLLQYNLCGRCGDHFFLDNWSTPFYGRQNDSLLRYPLNYEFEQRYRSNQYLQHHMTFP